MKKLILSLLFLGLVVNLQAQIELTDENAEEKLLANNDRLIVLDFYATWCGPCKTMEPILEEMTREFAGKVDFYKIDVDKSQVDDALGVNAMPTYFFIKNSENLEVIEGAMSKERLKGLILKHGGESLQVTNVSNSDDDMEGEFSDATINKIWDDWSELNSLAWHAYEEHKEVDVLLKSIKIAQRSIELDENHYNVDTLAALYYKTGNYTKALKEAKKAITLAKAVDYDHETTTELINKIIDKM